LKLRNFWKHLVSILCIYSLAAAPIFASEMSLSVVRQEIPDVATSEIEGQISANAVRQDDPAIAKELGVPIYLWTAPGVEERGIVVAIHGTTLHGGTFDAIARNLAMQGYVVYAPDLRGFGRWNTRADRIDHEADFFKSRADLVKLINTAKRDHPNLPVFSMGESVGANLSLWLASIAPDLISGVILSGTCITRHLDLCPPMFVDAARAMFALHLQVKTRPYVRRFLSEDPEVLKAYMDDPNTRKTMCLAESLGSLHVNKSTLWFADHIPATMPILVFNGTKDRMFDQSKTYKYFRKRHETNLKLVWLVGRGHIQLETSYLKEDVRREVTDWLVAHTPPTDKDVVGKATDKEVVGKATDKDVVGKATDKDVVAANN
jgi:alpha-beta hydrolase superfamily lysophospholipase